MNHQNLTESRIELLNDYLYDCAADKFRIADGRAFSPFHIDVGVKDTDLYINLNINLSKSYEVDEFVNDLLEYDDEENCKTNISRIEMRLFVLGGCVNENYVSIDGGDPMLNEAVINKLNEYKHTLAWEVINFYTHIELYDEEEFVESAFT